VRLLSLFFGLICFLGAVAGLIALAIGPRDLLQLWVTRGVVSLEVMVAPVSAEGAEGPEIAADAPFGDGEAITRLAIPRVGIDTEVVAAKMMELAGAITWQVPPFKAGHAEQTAGGGQPGNAVLFGHLTSVNAGNVFKDLGKVKAGDVIQVYVNDRRYDYVVVNVKTVPRTDVSVLGQTPSATVTLITCTGSWLPQANDFSHRLVVRGELTA
jgi:LPXTG-site transpeptidase (sortase) family protein